MTTPIPPSLKCVGSIVDVAVRCEADLSLGVVMSFTDFIVRLLVIDIGAVLLFLVVYGVLAWRMWRDGRKTGESIYGAMHR